MDVTSGFPRCAGVLSDMVVPWNLEHRHILRSLTALSESEFLKTHLRLEYLTLIFSACMCARPLKILHLLDEIRLFTLWPEKVGWRRVDGRSTNINFETLEIDFLGSYICEVFQNMMPGRTNGAV
jgi:hypothetical protein